MFIRNISRNIKFMKNIVANTNEKRPRNNFAYENNISKIDAALVKDICDELTKDYFQARHKYLGKHFLLHLS